MSDPRPIEALKQHEPIVVAIPTKTSPEPVKSPIVTQSPKQSPTSPQSAPRIIKSSVSSPKSPDSTPKIEVTKPQATKGAIFKNATIIEPERPIKKLVTVPEPMVIDDEPPQVNVVRPEPKTVVAIPTKEPEKTPEISNNQKAEPEKRTSQIMAEIRRNISSKKRQTQKDRDDKDLEKSKKVNEKLHNLIKEKTPEPVVTKEDDEPGNVFDYSFKEMIEISNGP